MRRNEIYHARQSGDGARARDDAAQPLLEFATNNARTGFRLHRLEVFNWGTFDQRVWTLEPGGGTALLTGANGSGKSTLVDALLTLLVPNIKRGYNLASGADTKKERDERSYVRGAYGKFRGEEAASSQTRFLRETKKDYSVVLASFYNEGFSQRVVLAHVFYFLNGDLRKFFIVSPHDLTIAETFSGFDDVRTLRRSLRESGAEVFDQFKDYSKHFRRAFGLRSEKALDLFNQTVSIKVIGDLNTFVREHMLEPGDPETYIAKLRTHFEDLTRTYDAIRKAREQIEKLRPIDRDGKAYLEFAGRIDELEALLQALPGVFAGWECDLLDEAVAAAVSELETARLRLRTAQEDVQHLRGRDEELVIAINQSEAGRQVQRIEEDIARTVAERDRLAREWERYRAAVDELGLAMPETEDRFLAQRKEAEVERAASDGEIESLLAQRDEATAAARRLAEGIDENKAELESLRKRTNQIPFAQLKLRQQILDDLRLSAEELPFIGELLQVRPEERAWEGAAERLLHSFALRIIVPERHYERFSKHVDRTHLGGRLVYSRVPESSPAQGIRDDDPARLYNKLEVKHDSVYREWLEAELTRFYDHVCCEIDEFRHEERAVTKSGLIKQNRVVHEKDDRHVVTDRRRYVLGWNNREKIRLIEEELRELEQRRDGVVRQIADFDGRRHALLDRARRLDDLLRYAEFAEIDKDRAVRRIESLKAEKRRLEEASDSLQQLKRDQAAVREQIASAEEHARGIDRMITLLDDRRDKFEKRQAIGRATLAPYDAVDLVPFAETLSGRLDGGLELDHVNAERERVRGQLMTEVRQLDKRKNDVHTTIVRAMERYKGDYPQETIEMDAHIDALAEYQQRLETLEREDLPRHEEQFRILLKNKLMEDVSFLESGLSRQLGEIEEKVEALNASLNEIAYTPSTFIQLETSPSRDVDVLEFRHQLKGLFAGNPDNDADSEAIFHRIRDLIHRFDTEERWTGKVTDVRNWVNFSIRERYRESGEDKNYITDSDGLSGGQKAKLAYTILAAAIAYQFGLDYGETRSKSFRFVVIDEAFSKIDEDNARYAMELFDKLDLQLLVVSPLGATRVVEDYISTCHFVANNDEGSFSQVRNLSLQEYEAEKARVVGNGANRQ